MKIPSLPGFDPESFSKYFKNTGWLMGARVLSMLIKMLVTIFALPNYLGDSGFGVFNFPIAFTFFFTSIAALGMDSFVTRELLRNPHNKNELLGSAFALRLVAGAFAVLLAYFVYTGIYSYTSYAPAAPLPYVMIVSLTCIVQSFKIIDSFFQSRAEGKYIMLVEVGGNMLSALLKLILILCDAPLYLFIWTLLFDVVFLAVGYCTIYTRLGYKISAWKYSHKTALYLLKHAWPLAISSIMVSLYIKIDQIMLDVYLGKSALGVYSVVTGLSEAWYFVPVAIVNALFPALMNARRDDPARYKKRLQNLYDLMVFISVGIALVVTLIAPYIYQHFYRQEFADGAPILAAHIWACVFVFLGTASNQYLIAEGLTHISLARTATGALLNIALNIWMIPTYGVIGAAYSTILTYFVATFSILFIRKTRGQGIALLKSLFLISLLSGLFRFVKSR